MKKKLAVLAAFAAIALLPNTSRAITGTVNATAKISPPLRIAPVRTLDFGDLLIDGVNTGSASISVLGAGLYTNVTQLGTPAAGRFTITGRAGQAINTLSIAGNAPATCTVVNAGDCAATTNTLGVASGTMDQAPGVIIPGATGTGVVTVNYGGVVNTAIDQSSGQYNMTLTVTAAY